MHNRTKYFNVPDERYLFHLYIAGQTQRSLNIFRNISQICRENLCENAEIKIIDVQKIPERDREDKVSALPTLIKKKPLPIVVIRGEELSEAKELLVRLGLKSK